ncbi:putative colanic acid biosynthesis acetyltransferase WcaF [Bradyrhizobium sp. USDA 3397]
MTTWERYKYRDTMPRSLKLRRLVWNIVWTVVFRPTPRGFLNGWRRTLLRMFGAKIGEGSLIAPSCFVWAPWNLEMGHYSVLGDHVDCYTMAKISIGSKVAVSQRSFLCAGSHDVTSLLRPLVTAPISIGDHSWISAECMVLPGVNIADGVVVGARSLVTKDLPAWHICAGNPCRPLKVRNIVQGEEAAAPSTGRQLTA